MNSHMNPQTDPGMRPLRLYRSVDDRVIAGVAGGVAVYFGVDSAIVRIIWFISFFVTGSLTFWVYLIMIAVVPPEPADWPGQSPWAPGGQPLGFQTGYSAPPTGTYPGSYESPSAGTNPADPNSVPDAAAGSTPAGQTGFAAADATQDELLDLAKSSEKIAGYVDGKELLKEIVVPGKLVNLVVKG